ncbi:MAG: tetratricopeptide repeat protein [Sphingomonadales bacterium]|nr:tetratricopeptide repeat protein [Sphingomonadales bacterium]NCQ22107.1 tetratricopeptide repeat protein [Sphingomonadales bacterium]NCT03212.1 tetratricopeptide repeat protein [Sphingomonadales bacterium]
MSVTAFAIALFAATPLAGAPAAHLNDPELAVKPLAAGRAEQALAKLQKASAADPQDPAVLINLGIAYAHAGDEDSARNAFEAALASKDVVELDTADGTATDSRRLARKAIKMLERGEFRAPVMRGDQLTLRD